MVHAKDTEKKSQHSLAPPGVIKQISKLKNFINYSDSSILCFRSSNRKLN